MAVQHVAKRADGLSRAEAHPGDFYETPFDLIVAQYQLCQRAATGHGQFLSILDPCIGSGAYGYTLRWLLDDQGYTMIHGCELHPRPLQDPKFDPYDTTWYGDFLRFAPVHYAPYDLAIFNPPYSDEKNRPLAHRFVLKALDCVRDGGVVSALVKAEFWNGYTRLNELFAAGLRPVYIVPSVSRISFDGTGKTSTQDYAIGVWVKGVDKRPEVLWVDWKDGIRIYD